VGTGGEWPARPPALLRHRTCGGLARAEPRCARCGEPLHARDVDIEPGPGAELGPEALQMGILCCRDRHGSIRFGQQTISFAEICVRRTRPAASRSSFPGPCLYRAGVLVTDEVAPGYATHDAYAAASMFLVTTSTVFASSSVGLNSTISVPA
jgi:hypothetical protein